MAVNTENIRRWIEQSDIDYISQYIKAWIPFNAWYNANYINLDSDRSKIQEIKNHANSFRNKINTLMEGNGQESIEFKSHIASLHQELMNTDIQGKIGRIWFNDILKEKNSTNQMSKNYNQAHYFLKVTRQDDKVVNVQVNLNKISNNSQIFSYSHTEYDLEHLENYRSFQSLSKSKQEQIRHYFNQINPIISKKIIHTNTNISVEDYYKCETIYFVRNSQNTNCYSLDFSKALIELLYQLRNVLFHGELVPSQASQKVYQHGYFCLKYLLEVLK